MEEYWSIFPVYGIGLVNDIFEKGTPDGYHHYKIVNVQNPERHLSGLELIFLELPKFRPSNQKEKRLRMLWLRFLSEIDEKTKRIDQELLAVPEIEEACALCEEAGFSEWELETYCTYWDEVRTAKTLLSGKWEEGRRSGVIEGRAEGRAEGILEGRIAVARQLLAYGGFAMQGIPEITDLSFGEPEELQEITSRDR